MKAKTGYTISMNSQILNNIDQSIISKKGRMHYGTVFQLEEKFLVTTVPLTLILGQPQFLICFQKSADGTEI